MGYLTTITFSNDNADQFQKHPKDTLEMIGNAQSGIQKNRGRDYDPIGNCANPVVIQKPRHADEHTLYLHAGNTVTDVWEAESDWVIDQFIYEMEWHTKRLKQMKHANRLKALKKEHEESSNPNEK